MMLEQGKITIAAVPCTPSAAALPRPTRSGSPASVAPHRTSSTTSRTSSSRSTARGRVFGGGLARDDDDRPRPTGCSRAQRSTKILRNPDGPAAALVAIDPRDGSVKAMFGGRNFRESQFNLATQAERQPGSSFKPIVLATALHQGLSPLTDVRLEAGHDLHRRPLSGRHELRERLRGAESNLADANGASRTTPSTRS